MTRRKQDIGVQSRIAHGHLLDNQELNLLERLDGFVLLGLVRHNVSTRTIQALQRERLAQQLLIVNDAVQCHPVDISTRSSRLFALRARLIDAAVRVTDTEATASGDKASGFLANVAGNDHKQEDEIVRIDSVEVVVQTLIHASEHWAFLTVHASEAFDVFDGHSRNLRSLFRSPFADSLESHIPHQTHLKAFDLFRNILERRLFGFQMGLRRLRRLIPYDFGIDGHFHAICIFPRSRSNAQITHTQEGVVLFYEERGFGMGAHKFGILPALCQDLAQYAEHERSIGSRMHWNEPIGLCRIRVVLDVNCCELRASILGIEVKMHHAFAGNGRIAAPNDNMVRAVPLERADKRRSRTEYFHHS